MRRMENASLTPKHRSLIKTRTFIRFGKRGCSVATVWTINENPCSNTQKQGFSFVVVKCTGRGVSPTTKTLIRSLRLAQISGFNSPHAAGLMLIVWGISGVLMMLVQELSANEKKKSRPTGYKSDGLLCAWFRSFRVAGR